MSSGPAKPEPPFPLIVMLPVALSTVVEYWFATVFAPRRWTPTPPFGAVPAVPVMSIAPLADEITFKPGGLIEQRANDQLKKAAEQLEEVRELRDRIRDLINRRRFMEAFEMARDLVARFPHTAAAEELRGQMDKLAQMGKKEA